jgi:hypothetical protein
VIASKAVAAISILTIQDLWIASEEAKLSAGLALCWHKAIARRSPLAHALSGTANAFGKTLLTFDR